MRPQHCLLSLLIGFMIASTENGLLAQQDDAGAITPSQVPDFLQPPPKTLLEKGLQPLSAELPDTRVRAGLLPPDASQGLFEESRTGLSSLRGENWIRLHYHWAATCNRYRPLYFEDAMLERHGQTRHPLIQPVVSGTRFFLTFPALPYAAVVDSPWPARSVLGHFRPGSGAPLLLQRPPLQADAGLFEAGMVVGLIFLIP